MKQTSFFFGFFCTPFVLLGNEVEAPPDQSMMRTLIVILIFFLFFYFLFWRPESKRRKELEQQRSQLKSGDRVTAMGIVGTVDQVLEHTAIIKMVDGSKIEFLLGAINDVTAPAEKKSEAKDEDRAKATHEG